MLKRGSLILAAFAAASLTVPALASGPQLQKLGAGIEVKPIRVAKTDANGNIVGPWIPYTGGAMAQNTRVAFDLYEDNPQDPNFAPGEKYQPFYNGQTPGTRYFFGTTYHNPFISNDMRVATGTAGQRSQRTQIAWSWNPPAQERCVILIRTAEDFGNTPAGPSFSNPYAGVALDFGPLNPGMGFYFANVTLTDPALFFQMPNDGQGANIINFDRDTNGTDATTAQPMLWVTKNANGGTNPSSQGPLQWDDDNPTNGQHEPNDELYDYANLVPGFPDPFGAMISFFVAEGGGPQTFAPTAFNVVRGALEAGALADILQSDDTYLRVRNGAIALPAQSPITMDFLGTSPAANGSVLSVRVENRVSIAGLAQRIQMRRYEGTPGFVQVDELIPAPTTDTVRNANAPAPQADFIRDSDREVTARLLVRANGPLFTNTWRTNVDQVQFSVTP